MRQTISAIIAVIGFAVAGAAPAMACDTCGVPVYSYQPAPYQPAPYQPPYACGGGCGQGYGYQAYGYRGQGYGYGYGATYERLAEPTEQYYPAEQYTPTTRYYYVNQGPTFTGPGRFAPYPTYRESAVTGYGYPRHRHYYDGAGVAGPAVYGHGGRMTTRWSTAGYYHGKRVLRRYN